MEKIYSVVVQIEKVEATIVEVLLKVVCYEIIGYDLN